MKEAEDLPGDELEDDQDFESLEDNDQQSRISAIDLAIKAIGILGSKESVDVIKTAKEFYLFIIGEDEEQ